MTKPSEDQQAEEAPVLTVCSVSMDEATALMHAHNEFPWAGSSDRSKKATWMECKAQEIIDAHGWDMHRDELLKAAAYLILGTPS
jgi:hypothetical protein